MNLLGLLVCDWGRQIWTRDYRQRCAAPAVQRVALHGHGEPRVVQLCAPHREFVLSETDPRDTQDPA